MKYTTIDKCEILLLRSHCPYVYVYLDVYFNTDHKGTCKYWQGMSIQMITMLTSHIDDLGDAAPL
jgi:hypothetical protein